MGSWSVYCGISRLSITSGDKCVFLPLKKNHGSEYLPYIPATLPIFGVYDDYGGLEGIEEDENTKLIEEHFNCTIHEFCYFFTRGCIRDDEDDFPVHLKNVEEIKDWKFMFINRAVYDHMSTYVHDGYGGKGNIDLGDPGILKLLGFQYVREVKGRYNQEYKFDGKTFHSDGTWLNQQDEHQNLYTFEHLKALVNILPELDWVGEKTMHQLWKYLDDEKRFEQLGWILGRRYNFLHPNQKPKTLADKYFYNFDTFGESISGLVSVRHNLHPMSGYFEPYILYLTPQDGCFEEHQKLLEKFAEINKENGKHRGYFDE